MDDSEGCETCEPVWMPTARHEVGVSEIVGPKHNPRVLEYLRATTLGRWGRRRDETPWCAAYVSWVLQQCGMESTRSAAARSYLDYGIALARPEIGCIAVFKRKRGHHVAFVTGWSREHVECLGGNQSNQVSIADRSAEKLMRYCWPVPATP